MAQKTTGSRNKTRQKLTKHTRDKETISDHLKNFDEGDQVRIDVDSAIHEGLPHPRFHGRTATVTGKRGQSYIVELEDGGQTKELPVYPAHLEQEEE
ncbi:MAG: 50S ribosomal protein L21e [Candidatus Nanohaloarchaea archaeon]|nr:50S ribosomal protein L21e [Candidatus Nanohaloarchaea archaeon]